MTSRRCFLGVTAIAVAASASGAHAQAPAKVWRIGYLTQRTGPAPFDQAFVQAMRDLGYVVGRNLVIEYRWAGNDPARLQALADELARLDVDVVVAAATPAVRAVMRATRTIPIVIAAAPDPLGAGLVASLNRPGGNVTGVTIMSTDLAQKRLQLLREIVPGMTRIGLLAIGTPGSAVDPARSATTLIVSEMQAAARPLAVAVVVQTIDGAADLPRAFARFERERLQALLVQVAPVTFEHRATILDLAARQRLPAMYEIRVFVDDGGLVSYGPDLAESYRRAATYVDRILKGARPGDLAIEQPGKYEMVVNLRTAQALGLAIPQPLLLRADEVIR